MKLISLKDVTVQNGMHYLLNHVSIDIYAGKVNVIIGESGSGKSMLSNVLIDQVNPALSVQYDRYIYKGQPVKEIRLLLGKEIGYISQDYTHAFNEHMKLGKQLIAIYRNHYQVSKKQASLIVQDYLNRVNLGDIDVMNSYRFSLSGGQLERVLIASVLMLEPEFIIADEPTASLDSITGYHLMELIKNLASEQQITLLVITHNLSHVMRFSDYINVMREGQLIESGTLHDLQKSQSPYINQLFSYRSRLMKEGKE